MTPAGPDRGREAKPSIRSLDPVDPRVDPPDGARLLRAVLSAPSAAGRRRVARRLLQLVPVGLAIALAVGVVAVMASGGDRSDEQEAVMGSGSVPIVHYVVRESDSIPGGRPSVVSTQEIWQLADGARARTITHWEGAGPLKGTTSEDVVTRTEQLSFRQGDDQRAAGIIRYRSTDDFAAIPEQPPAFGAPAIGGSREVGDPRRLADRLARGDKDVVKLPGATVRGIEVDRFQIGDCRDAARADTPVAAPHRVIVALARDTQAPVRITYEPCSSDGFPLTRILDYLSFDELPQTPGNLRRLELSPHPGVPVVDGIEIDKREERLDPAQTARPTPTPRAP